MHAKMIIMRSQIFSWFLFIPLGTLLLCMLYQSLMVSVNKYLILDEDQNFFYVRGNGILFFLSFYGGFFGLGTIKRVFYLG